MSRSTPRPIRISDAIILIAFTALGLAWCRFSLDVSQVNWGDLWAELRGGGHPWSVAGLRDVAVEMMRVLFPLPLTWSVAVLVCRLRAQRPPRRDLWCQPGFLACVAAVFASLWRSVDFGLHLLLGFLSEPAEFATVDYGAMAFELAVVFGHLIGPRSEIGGAVSLLWLVTWAGGRWHAEPGWVDRAGRLLGVSWIATSLATTASIYF